MTDTSLPYPDDTGRTHYEGCWEQRGHHNCAVLRVREVEEQRRQWEESFKALAEAVIIARLTP